ncbi:hypothetical protein ACJ73_07667 [Blastomyces percursus]|uniref:Clr5 domain-containing protein n=1 Tax=Blastomyces percursus TaxID=1658174 RepID=A0A1J9PYL8_9EURO|nr:hypothetical protein ACJ73_07667 [Blastomyces percursus]
MAEQGTNQYTSLSTVQSDSSAPDANHTCHHIETQNYSDENLPPLLFQLDPPTAPSTTPIPNLVENGQEVNDYDGAVIRDFPFLPRYISKRPLAWQLEFWMRLDSRLTYRDIKARMTVEKADLPSDNSLNMRREREARTPLGLSCWTIRRGAVTRAEIERVEKLNREQVRLNTTMDVEYSDKSADARTAVPERLRARNLAGTPPACYPWDMFLVNNRFHVPGTRLAEALALHEQLLEAVANSNVNNWRELPRDQLPPSWVRRRGNNRRTEGTAPNDASREASPHQVQGTGAQANPSLVGPSDRTDNDNDRQVGITRLLNPPHGPALPGAATRNDQFTGTGQTNISRCIDGYHPWEGVNHGAPQIPATMGFPTGLRYGFGGMGHGLPGFGETFGWTNDFGYQPNPSVTLEPGVNQEGDDPYVAHPLPASTPFNYNTFGLQQQQQEMQPIVSEPQTTSPNSHHQPGPSLPQSDPRRSPGCMAPGSDDMDMSTPVNQGQHEEEFHRFNGSGPRSILQDPAHRLNIDTDVIMQRNDPFRRLQERLAPVSSFEDFMEDEMGQ